MVSEATRTSQRDCLLLWEELEGQWKDLITLTKDVSGLAAQLLDVGQCLGSSYPDQVEKGELITPLFLLSLAIFTYLYLDTIKTIITSSHSSTNILYKTLTHSLCSHPPKCTA